MTTEPKQSAMDVEEIMVPDDNCKTCDGYGHVPCVEYADGIPFMGGETCPDCLGAGRAPPK